MTLSETFFTPQRRGFFRTLMLSALALKTSPHTLLVIGDSLSAEYGIASGTGWVSLLTKKLQTTLPSYAVVNASISGDTSASGLSRMSALLQTHQPSVVLIELGANDALRGLSLLQTQNNLSQMVAKAHQSAAKVMLIGIQVPPNYGQTLNAELKAMYTKVAKTQACSLMPFLMEGLQTQLQTLSPEQADLSLWFQDDRLHPLARAHPFILQGLWPYLEKLLPLHHP